MSVLPAERVAVPAPDSARDALLASVRSTFQQGVAIVERKNRDYGSLDDPFANLRRSAEFLGISVEKAILLRTLDKLARVDNLAHHAAFVAEESMEDSLIDAINYLALLKAWREIGR